MRKIVGYAHLFTLGQIQLQGHTKTLKSPPCFNSFSVGCITSFV